MANVLARRSDCGRILTEFLNPLPQYNFFPFGSKYRGGIEITVGSVTAPGVFEIVAAQSRGTSLVRVFTVNSSSVNPTPTLINAFRAIGGSPRGVSVSRLPGTNGAADQILVAGGQRNAGRVETWARNGNGFIRAAAFAAFGGTTAAVSTAAINADNIFAVEGVGGRNAGIRKHASPSTNLTTEVQQTSTLVPTWRIAVLRR